MKLTPKIQKAINVASTLHSKQFRKSDQNLPYISHPFSVAWILTGYSNNEDVIVAGILHDVLEDAEGYNYQNLKNDFGERVARIVREVSQEENPNPNEDRKATWEKRKRRYLNNLKNASFEALMVSAADKIHNLRSMREAYQKQGENLWSRFNAPPEKKLWFYGEVAKIVVQKLNNQIAKELLGELKKMDHLLNKNSN